MFSPRHAKHDYDFHGDDALHDQTPEVQSIVASLPSGAKALGQLFVHGTGEEGKRALIAKLPMNHPLSKSLMAKGVKHYWGSMLHPPLSYRGDAYQYRSADGADNSILHPQLGKAGLPYAKSVPGKTGTHGARPDPGDLFDLLMARKNDTESSSGLSSMLLYHATIIIHDIFRTNADDKNISDTSSYLDLSPLYGCDKATQDTVRQKRLGLLKPDSFAERRLLLQPPGVCIYLVMYNRFHNYVAQQLLEINENGKFALPYPQGSEKWEAQSVEERKKMMDKQDEDLFQTARLITCGLYINISIHDYLRVLMGFHAKDTPWTLDPRIEIPGDDKTGVQRGIGNQVSVEFNLLYRFHSAISTRDREWSENFFKLWLQPFVRRNEITQEQLDSGDIPVPVFKEIIESGNGKNKTKEAKDQDLDHDNKARFLPAGLETIGFDPPSDGAEKPTPIYKYKRDASGKFDDAQLVAEMVKVIEDPICQFGAQNIPKMFKAIEILGILQARKWEVATLNEFREFFGLERHKHFEDINTDKDITDALRDLYDDPDMVELYPGLICEGTGRCLDPGTPGPNKGATALWSGVFCDAVTLVRSDRFYTIDWNVGSLTSWGMHEVTSDPNVLKGSVFHRLFQRAFPGHFKHNSVHLWQPFYTPAMNIVFANEQNYLSSLDLSDLEFAEVTMLDPTDVNFGQAIKEKGYNGLKGMVHRRDVLENLDAVPKPKPIIKVSNYYDIRDKVLGKNKSIFQNPGLLDKDMIHGKYLEAMMTGKSKSFDDAARLFQRLVTPEIQDMFLDYFVKMSKEITEREKRKFQKLKPSKEFFEQERRKLRILKLSQGTLQREEQNLNNLEKKLRGRESLTKKDLLDFSAKEQKALSGLLQVYQIDVVRDYVIPVITRFVVDFLGFWDTVKTPVHPDRKYNENQIYQHIHNCQNYLTYDSDETTLSKRRIAFKGSIAFLKTQAEHGAYQAQEGLFGWLSRKTETTGDQEYVVKLRDFGVKTSRALARKLANTEEVAAMMLVVTLDAAHKSVMTFTEVLAYFIDHPHVDNPDVSHWTSVQNLAYEDTPKATAQLKRYILEAQRIRVDLPLIRVYSPAKANETFKLRLGNDKKDTCTLVKGDKVLLQLLEAQKNSEVFHHPDTLSLDPETRYLKDYLIYGQSDPAAFEIKQLTIIGLTGMIKYIASLKELRVAHDKLGRLKRVKTPYGVKSYMTVQWDQLVPFPTTWSLRFNGEGRGVYDGKDNADQGHGIDQVYQKPTAIPPGGTYISGSGSTGRSTATLPAVQENGTAKPSGKLW